MKEFFIATGTVTYALRAKDILEENGYRANVKKWNDKSGRYGCGYGVLLKAESVEKIKELLSRNGIRIIDIIVRQR